MGALSFPGAVLVRNNSTRLQLSTTHFVTRDLLYINDNTRPYNIYPSYIGYRTLSRPSVHRCKSVDSSTTFGISTYHTIHSSYFILPGSNSGGICVLGRIRGVGSDNRGTLLGVFRRPPSCICFVVAYPDHSTVLSAILSHTAMFSLKSRGSSTLFSRSATSLTRGVTGTLLDPTRASLLTTIDPLRGSETKFGGAILYLGDVFLSTIGVGLRTTTAPRFSRATKRLSSTLATSGLCQYYNILSRLFSNTTVGRGRGLLLASLYCGLQRTINGWCGVTPGKERAGNEDYQGAVWENKWNVLLQP